MNGQRKTSSWTRYELEQRGASAFGLGLVAIMGVLGWLQAVPNAALVVALLIVAMYEFQKRLDQGVPLIQLTCLLSILQWLVGPVLNYNSDIVYGRYSMYVSESRYFQFALPATAFYVLIMLASGASVRQKNLLRNVQTRHFFTIGILLNIVGIAAALASLRVGGGLAFLMHLLSQLRYVGALYFLFSRHQLRYICAAASCLQLVTASLDQGMFHDLLLWLAILFCYWFAQRTWTVPVKLTMLTLATMMLFSIQVIKQEYRSELRLGKRPNILLLIYQYVTPGGRAWETDSLGLVVTRLNQGWIISAVLHNVPEGEPFAEGETVKDAILSSIAPRILWSDKKTAGGRENFRRFTGLPIADSTSMAIGPLGEAYANFGDTGGIVMMMVYGAGFALFFYGTLRFSAKHPTFLFWMPLIFYQAIKAETELSVVMNQLTKGSIVAFGGYFLMQRLYRDRFKAPAAQAVRLPEPQALDASLPAEMAQR